MHSSDKAVEAAVADEVADVAEEVVDVVVVAVVETLRRDNLVALSSLAVRWVLQFGLSLMVLLHWERFGLCGPPGVP